MSDKVIEFGGIAHHFPADATDDEIAQALDGARVPGQADHLTHALPTDEQIQEFVNPTPKTTMGQIGSGISNFAGKLALGARQGLDAGIHAASESTTPGSLGSMLQSVGAVPPPGSTDYDPGEYAQVRKQLDSRTPTEALTQAAAGIGGAVAMGGASAGGSLGTGLLSGLESGDPNQGAQSALVSAVMGPLMGKAVQYTAAAKFGQIKNIIKLLGVGGSAMVGGKLGGTNGAIAGAILGSIGVSANSQKRLYDYVNNDQINRATKLLWSILPPAYAQATADSSSKPHEVKFDDARNALAPTSPESLAALAKRRLEAQSVIR